MPQCTGPILLLLMTRHTEHGRLFHQASPNQPPQICLPHNTNTRQQSQIHETLWDHNNTSNISINKIICQESTTNTKVQDHDHQHSHSKKCLKIPTARVCYTAAKMTQFWARFKQNCTQIWPSEKFSKYYRIAPQNRAELVPSLFQNYYYEFPYTWIFRYWFLYAVCLWASLLHWHICWALKY